jgi:hypothetical protein
MFIHKIRTFNFEYLKMTDKTDKRSGILYQSGLASNSLIDKRPPNADKRSGKPLPEPFCEHHLKPTNDIF